MTLSRSQQRYVDGKTQRRFTPRRSHGDVTLATARDPVAMIEASSQGRVPALVPLRYQRMLASPFAFFRGVSLIQAADLASGPDSGIIVQACGDAHLMNFGFFASPERNLLFDINDFDETHPAPWEWDLKRLLVSLVLAGREQGFSAATIEAAIRAAITNYQAFVHRAACMGAMAVWYDRVSMDMLQQRVEDDPALKKRLNKLAQQAVGRTNEKLLPKITTVENGVLRFKEMPPTLFHTHDDGSLLPNDDSWLASGNWQAMVEPMMADYLATLVDDRRALLSRFRMEDMAFKVVGVGSVGTRCLVMLLQDDGDEPLFLQIKEARPSVLEGHTGRSAFSHEGERVVSGQRLMQAASDVFLGWTTGPAGRHFYVRQLRDMKTSVSLAEMDAGTLEAYGRVCARTLARAHAKSSGRAAEIAGYFGQSAVLVDALVRYAHGYADQVEADYDAYRQAVQQGRISIDTGDPLKTGAL